MKIRKRNQIMGNALFYIASLVNRTARLEVTGFNHLEDLLAEKQPIIAAAWHGYNMHLFSLLRQRLPQEKMRVMIPDDWRGETLYQWLKRANQEPVPMDLHDRGMETARKFAKLVQSIKEEKYHTIINPDGPSGPSLFPKPGIFYMAAKVGAPILPIGAYTRHKYVNNRWDAYEVPFPFSRLSFVIGEPILVGRRYELGEVREKLTAALHRATMQAKANYYAKRGGGETEEGG
jgi:lysophospholipid acyltransferase (LPLAT)-like uncharacterized protein